MPKLREYALWIENCQTADGTVRFGIHNTEKFPEPDIAIATLTKKAIEELANECEELEVSICLANKLTEPIHTFKMTTTKDGEKQTHYKDCKCSLCGIQPS